MAGNLTPYQPPCTSTRRRPWWQRSYAWNLWATLGVGVLLWALFLAAYGFVQLLEAWS